MIRRLHLFSSFAVCYPTELRANASFNVPEVGLIGVQLGFSFFSTLGVFNPPIWKKYAQVKSYHISRYRVKKKHHLVLLPLVCTVLETNTRAPKESKCLQMPSCQVLSSCSQKVHVLKLTVCTWKCVVGRLLAFWEALFSNSIPIEVSCQGIHQNVRFRVEKVLVIHSFHQASEHQCETRWLGLRGKKTLTEILGFWSIGWQRFTWLPIFQRFGCWDYVWSTSFFLRGGRPQRWKIR